MCPIRVSAGRVTQKKCGVAVTDLDIFTLIARYLLVYFFYTIKQETQSSFQVLSL